MREILIALIMGAAAGAIDVLPMLKQKESKVPLFSILSLFAQWVLLGLMIPFVSWRLEPWLKGSILGVLGMLPTMITLYFRNKRAIPTTALAGGALGSAIGYLGSLWI